MKLIVDIDEMDYKFIKSIKSIMKNSTTFQRLATDLLVAVKYGDVMPNDIGDMSDGYHTFNQLYHQRAVLFATIVKQNNDKAWKSFKHEDGKYCFDSDGEWFIVGVDTPQGSYTYHYSKEYWDMFDCEELPCAKHWDGHTEEDVTRLFSLGSATKQQVFNELIDWGCLRDAEQCKYVGDNIWAIKTGFGIGLVKAESYDEAYDLYLDASNRYADNRGNKE